MKKLTASVFVLMLALVATCFIESNDNMAYATETTSPYIEESGDFISENVAITKVGVAPEAQTEGYESWLFAGWYLDQECKDEDAIKDISAKEGQSAWAKYVPADLLTVKVQVKNGTQGSEKTNMRVVSSVDSLSYSKVGFYIEYHTGLDDDEDGKEDLVTKTFSGSKVFGDIIASEESGVDYEYNSKVIDTKSEWFITATVTNIPMDKYENNFVIKPYWETYDGTVVYGQTRYVKVSDSYSNVVNVPVKVGSDTNLSELTVDGSAPEEVRYYDGEDYATLMVKVDDRTALPSLTKYTVSDGQTALYRNLQSKYSGSAGDQSWYTTISDEDEFVIVTATDLFGLADTVNGKTIDGVSATKFGFSGKTIYLGADVVVNENMPATSAEWAQYLETKTPEHEWPVIGYTSQFYGTFDGMGESISGIYYYDDSNVTTANYSGLFGYVNTVGKVANFGLINSYFESAPSGGWTSSGNTYALIGSVVGQLGGTVDNVYSNATVVSAFGHVGGLVGRTNSGGATKTATISNSWFDGDIAVTKDSMYTAANTYECVGGILGNVISANMLIEDCLNTGNITFTYTTASTDKVVGVGGILGGNQAKGGVGTLSKCLDLGTLLVKDSEGTVNTVGVGSMVGTNRNKITIEDCYTTSTLSTVGFNGQEQGDEEQIGASQVVASSDITGDNAYIYTDLDFYSVDNEEGVWAVVDGGTPILKNWYDGTTKDDFSEVAIARTNISWYYNGCSYAWDGWESATVPGTWTATENLQLKQASDLWGFAYLVNEGIQNFSKKTVSLANDIALNNGKATDWADGKNLPKHSWIPIGYQDVTAKKFAGTFDGNNYTISGLYLSRDTRYSGLFGMAAASTIQDFKLVNSYLECTTIYDSSDGTTCAHLGSIVGHARNTKVSLKNIYSDAILYSSTVRNGGLVGYAEKAMHMQNCWYDGTITLESDVVSNFATGGLLGYSNLTGNSALGNWCLIDTCLFTGTININYKNPSTQYNSAYNVGGLCGRDGTTAPVKMYNSLSAGTINLNWNRVAYEDTDTTKKATYEGLGTIIGSYRLNSVVSNVYATTDLNVNIAGKATKDISCGTCESGEALSDAQTYLEGLEDYMLGSAAQKTMNLAFSAAEKTAGGYAGYWVARKGAIPIPSTLIKEEDTAMAYTEDVVDIALEGEGTSDAPYLISTAGELRGFSKLALTNDYTGTYFKLNADIKLNDGTATEWKENGMEAMWLPIGVVTDYIELPFKGSFDGNGHTISGIYVEGDLTYIGLFGYTTATSEIGNFNIVNSYFSGTKADNYVGSVAADMRGKVYDVYSNAVIEGNGSQIGGIIARANGGNIKTTSTVTNSEVTDDAGNTTIDKTTTVTYTRGTVTVENGWFDGQIHASSITATNTYIGGIVGVDVQGVTKLNNCLFTGTITTPETTKKNVYIGGLIGSSMAQSANADTEETSKTTETDGVSTTTNTTTVHVYTDGGLTTYNDGYSKIYISSSISAGTMNCENGYTGAVVGYVKNEIGSGYPEHTYLILDNVFATKDCYTVTYTKQEDTVSGDVTAKAIVEGSVIQSYNTDRLIGYCTEEVAEGETSARLDFAVDWSMRLSGVPVPTALKDIVGVVAEGALVEGTIVDVSTLDIELGLANFSKTLANAVHKGDGNYVIACEGVDKTAYEAYLATLVTNGFEESANNGAESGVYAVTYTKAEGDWILSLAYEENTQVFNISICTTGTDGLATSLSSAEP